MHLLCYESDHLLNLSDHLLNLACHVICDGTRVEDIERLLHEAQCQAQPTRSSLGHRHTLFLGLA